MTALIQEIIDDFTKQKGEEDYVVLSTRYGEVEIRSITLKQQAGTSYLDIILGSGSQGGDPHFRIFNPPQYVYDPEGETEVDGKKYRRDPLMAVAETVAGQGGNR